MEDFGQIYLEEKELKALQGLASGPQDRDGIERDTVRRLKSLGFAKETFLPDGPEVLLITEAGRSFLAFDRERKRLQKAHGREFWIPTLIALLALLMSILDRCGL